MPVGLSSTIFYPAQQHTSFTAIQLIHEQPQNVTLPMARGSPWKLSEAGGSVCGDRLESSNSDGMTGRGSLLLQREESNLSLTGGRHSNQCAPAHRGL